MRPDFKNIDIKQENSSVEKQAEQNSELWNTPEQISV